MVTQFHASVSIFKTEDVLQCFHSIASRLAFNCFEACIQSLDLMTIDHQFMHASFSLSVKYGTITPPYDSPSTSELSMQMPMTRPADAFAMRNTKKIMMVDEAMLKCPACDALER